MDGSPETSNHVVVLLRQFHAAAETLNNTATELMVELGLSRSHLLVLKELNSDGRFTPMRELIDKLDVDPSSVTLATDRLVTAGLAVREEHPEDRRQRIVRLTNGGAQLRLLLVERLESVLPVSNLTEAEQRELAGLLDKASRSAEARD